MRAVPPEAARARGRRSPAGTEPGPPRSGERGSDRGVRHRGQEEPCGLFPFLPFPAFSRLPGPGSAALGCEQHYAIKKNNNKKGGISLFCGLICLYFKLPNPSDHLEELFLVSLIMAISGSGGARYRPPSRDRRCPPGVRSDFPSVAEDSGKAHLQSKDGIFQEIFGNTGWRSHCSVVPRPCSPDCWGWG